MLAAWVAFPVCLVVLGLGLGLLIERLTDLRLPGALLIPVGVAGAIVLALPFTLSGTTVGALTPVVVAVALAGLTLARGRLRVDGWAVGCALIAFIAYAAPFAFSGHTTVGGYIRRDDAASWLTVADGVGHHGMGLHGLSPSTRQLTLNYYVGSDYPVGGLVGLIIGGRLLGTDLSWLYQPYLALLAALLALTLYTLTAELIPSRPLRMVVAGVASQSALLFGYALWGGFKETVAAWLLALCAVLVARTLAEADGRPRRTVALAVAASALIADLSVGGGAWLLPLLAAGLAIAWITRTHARTHAAEPTLADAPGPAATPPGRDDVRALASVAVAACALALVLSIPSLVHGSFLDSAAASTVTDQSRRGNLIHALNPLQALGIWPTGDFRVNPHDRAQTDVLLAVAAVGIVLGALAAWRRRAWGLVAYLAAAVVGCLVIVVPGSEWVSAKAYATAAPALTLAALVGAAAVLHAGRRAPGAVMLAAVIGGVLWSNVLAYGDVSLTPHARFDELHAIGQRVTGQGPTLMTDYEPYGARWYLRAGDTEGASELRWRPDRLRNGRELGKGLSADIDAFQLSAVEQYRTLVLRRSPLASRPPSNYQLVWAGRYYDIWQRAPTAARIDDHLPLGNARAPGAVPACASVRRVARMAPARGWVAAVGTGPTPLIVNLGRDGASNIPITLNRSARYGLWVNGSFSSSITLKIDGRTVARAREQQGYDNPPVPLANRTLSAGSHHLTLTVGGGDLHPGSAAGADVRSVVIAPARPWPTVRYVRAAHPERLCGQRWDWIEAVG